MRNRLVWTGARVLALACLFAAPSGAPAPSPARAHGALADLPLRFEPNEGQFDPAVRYLARSHGMMLRLTDDGAVLTPPRRAGDRNAAPITMRVVGAAKGAPLVASEPAPTRTSYFVGRDRAKWRSDVRSYGRVTAQSVLPGVDETFYGTPGGIEYDLVVAPGARAESVELSFDGADRIALRDDGDLELDAPGGVLVQRRPRVYQRSADGLHDVGARYRITGKTTVALSFADYDRGKDLVIDPTFEYSTFYGGTDTDASYGVAVDAQGATYIVGSTASSDLTTTANAYQTANNGPDDLFIAKIAADGSLVYATYLGGSDTDDPFAISVDSAGNAYVTGETQSTDYPTTPNAPYATLNGVSDVFVTELSADGSSLVYSTLLGGSNQELGYGIATDSAGATYVTGMTESTDWPTLNAQQPAPGGGFYEAFVVKLAPGGGSLAYSTYLGGNGADFGYGIAVDAAGDAFVTGRTLSTNFPTQGAVQASNKGGADAFVTAYDPGGQTLAFSTYLGGSGAEIGQSIALDSVGSIYVTGMTASTDFPTQNAEQITSGGGTSDAFVTKLAPGGGSLVYSTYLGGNAADWGWGIGVDAKGDAYVAGSTSSTNFPTVAPLQAVYGGTGDAFVTKLEPAGGTLAFSTYLGGAYNDVARGLAVRSPGYVYVAGYTTSTDFPQVNPVQPKFGGSEDSFVTSIATIDEDAGAPFDAGQRGTDAASDTGVGPGPEAGSDDGGSEAAVDSGPEPPPDAGSVDSGPAPSPDAGPVDSGPTIDATAPTDAGSPGAPVDASAPSPDASDAGPVAKTPPPPPPGGSHCTTAAVGLAAPSFAAWPAALSMLLAAFVRRRTRAIVAVDPMR
jgi:hypothetical protein